jgi:hypothetical protein
MYFRILNSLKKGAELSLPQLYICSYPCETQSQSRFQNEGFSMASWISDILGLVVGKSLNKKITSLKVLVHGKLVATRLSKSMKHIQMPRWLHNSSTFRLYFRYSNSRAEMVMQRVADLTSDHTTDERVHRLADGDRLLAYIQLCWYFRPRWKRRGGHALPLSLYLQYPLHSSNRALSSNPFPSKTNESMLPVLSICPFPLLSGSNSPPLPPDPQST